MGDHLETARRFQSLGYRVPAPTSDKRIIYPVARHACSLANTREWLTEFGPGGCGCLFESKALRQTRSGRCRALVHLNFSTPLKDRTQVALLVDDTYLFDLDTDG